MKDIKSFVTGIIMGHQLMNFIHGENVVWVHKNVVGPCMVSFYILSGNCMKRKVHK